MVDLQNDLRGAALLLALEEIEGAVGPKLWARLDEVIKANNFALHELQALCGLLRELSDSGVEFFASALAEDESPRNMISFRNPTFYAALGLEEEVPVAI